MLLLTGTLLLAQGPTSTFRLPNGLRVVLLPDDSVNATSVCVYHFNGVRNDPADIRGASYLYQFLLFNGNERLDPGDHIRYISRIGGYARGRVNYDNSYFLQVVPASETNLALWLESEKLRSLRLDDNSIELRKKQIFERYSRLLENNVGFRAQTWVNSILLQGTIYETPLFGELQRLKFMENNRIREQYAQFRNPANILLIIAGKISIDDLTAAINRCFQDLPPGPQPHPIDFAANETRRTYVYKNWVLPRLNRPFAVFGIRSPALLSNSHLFFEFIRYYLTDARVSRLDTILNRTNKLNVDITVGYTEFFEANALTIQVTAPTRLNLEKAKYILFQELLNLQNSLLSSNSLKIVKTIIELDIRKTMATLDGRALSVAESIQLTGGTDYQQVKLKRLQRLTAYDIMYTAKKFLTKESMVLLNVYGE